MHDLALIAIAAVLSLSSCALLGGNTAAPLDLVACAAQDERLSVAITDPETAIAYVKKLELELRRAEPEAVRDAADLLARVLECLEAAK